MKHGSAFRFVSAGIGPHVRIVISNPDINAERVITVGVSTWRGVGDPSCILQPDEHPVIRHVSHIRYDASQVCRLESLLKPPDPRSRHMQPVQAFTGALLDRIMRGAAASEFMKLAHQDILRDQGLIE